MSSKGRMYDRMKKRYAATHWVAEQKKKQLAALREKKDKK